MYKFDIEEIGKRQLKNRCLQYLMLLPKYEEYGLQQFEASLKTNMSDLQPALVALANLDSPHSEKALDHFYNAWKHDALVVDKWLAIQAGSNRPGTLQTVKNLVHHEAFDIKNPNKVYSSLDIRAACAVNFIQQMGKVCIPAKSFSNWMT